MYRGHSKHDSRLNEARNGDVRGGEEVQVRRGGRARNVGGSILEFGDDGSVRQVPMNYLDPKTRESGQAKVAVVSRRDESSGSESGDWSGIYVNSLEGLYNMIYQMEMKINNDFKITSEFQSFVKSAKYTSTIISEICNAFYNELKMMGNDDLAMEFLTIIKQTKYHELFDKKSIKSNDSGVETRPFFVSPEYVTNENVIKLSTPDTPHTPHDIFIELRVTLASIIPDISRLVVYPFGNTKRELDKLNITLVKQSINFRFTDSNNFRGKVKGILSISDLGKGQDGQNQGHGSIVYVFTLENWHQEEILPNNDKRIKSIDINNLVLPLSLAFKGKLLC